MYGPSYGFGRFLLESGCVFLDVWSDDLTKEDDAQTCRDTICATDADARFERWQIRFWWSNNAMLPFEGRDVLFVFVETTRSRLDVASGILLLLYGTDQMRWNLSQRQSCRTYHLRRIRYERVVGLAAADRTKVSLSNTVHAAVKYSTTDTGPEHVTSECVDVVEIHEECRFLVCLRCRRSYG